MTVLRWVYTVSMAAMFKQGKSVRHYYGDTVRVMFLSAAIVYAVAMPLFGELLPIGTMGGIAVVLALALFAGITNPHSKIVMILDVAIAGVGLFLLQNAALMYFSVDGVMLFILREASVILFLIAFYESVKSLRSMLLGTIGHDPTRDEFTKK